MRRCVVTNLPWMIMDELLGSPVSSNDMILLYLLRTTQCNPCIVLLLCTHSLWCWHTRFHTLTATEKNTVSSRNVNVKTNVYCYKHEQVRTFWSTFRYSFESITVHKRRDANVETDTSHEPVASRASKPTTRLNYIAREATKHECTMATCKLHLPISLLGEHLQNITCNK